MIWMCPCHTTKKGRFQNKAFTESQTKEKANMVSLSHAPKSAHYRDELQPFIGSCIEAIGQLDGIETTKSYNRLLIDNPRGKHPAGIVLFRAHCKAPHPQCGFSSLISLSMNGFPSSFFFLRFDASFLDNQSSFWFRRRRFQQRLLSERMRCLHLFFSS